jgi:hypothetical protein
MALDPELARLTAGIQSDSEPDPAALQEAAQGLHFDWPAEYVALMETRDGGEGFVGEGYVRLDPARDLIAFNRALQTPFEWPQPEAPASLGPHLERGQQQTDAPPDELRPGLVFFGSDGGGEYLAFDRHTGNVLLVPAIGDDEDAILLGSTLSEALGHFERGDIFDDPVYPLQSGSE